MNDVRDDLTEIIPEGRLRNKFDEFREAFVDALVRDDHIESSDDWYGMNPGMPNIWHQVHMNANFILSGTPQSLDRAMEHLITTGEKLYTADSDFSALSGELDEWDTLAAGAFRRDYLDKFQKKAANQLVITGELAGLAGGYREIIASAREDLDEILDGAITACRTFEPGSSGGGGWITAFRVAGSVAAGIGLVALALGTGPGGAGAGLATFATVTGGLANIGGTAAAELSSDPGASPGGFPTAMSILSHLNAVTDSLCETMTAASDALLNATSRNLDEVGDGTPLVLQRPEVANLGESEYVTAFPYAADGPPATVNLYQLWLAGTSRLPLVAVSYSEAAGELSGTHGSVASGLSDAKFAGNGAADSLVYLIELLQSRLVVTRDDLVDTGGVLIQIANAYAARDGKTDEMITMINRDIRYEHYDGPFDGPVTELPTETPVDVPAVTASDPGEAPDPDDLEGAEAPGSYNRAMPGQYVVVDPLNGTTIYVPPSNDPDWVTSEEEYDPSGRYGGYTPPPGSGDDD